MKTNEPITPSHRVNLENELAQISRECWSDNAVEGLVGLLSSLVSLEQLSVLIANLDRNLKQDIEDEARQAIK